MQNLELLTQKQSLQEERWEVRVSSELYTLNGLQVEVLKQAAQSGNIRLVWFGDFAINISFISSIYKVKSNSNTFVRPQELQEQEIPEDEKQKYLDKMAKLRQTLAEKGVIDETNNS